MSAALERAEAAVRRLLPQDRLRLLTALWRYCRECGRLGVTIGTATEIRYSVWQKPLRGWFCDHCGMEWWEDK